LYPQEEEAKAAEGEEGPAGADWTNSDALQGGTKKGATGMLHGGEEELTRGEVRGEVVEGRGEERVEGRSGEGCGGERWEGGGEGEIVMGASGEGRGGGGGGGGGGGVGVWFFLKVSD
jgi:hypothetical protein